MAQKMDARSGLLTAVGLMYLLVMALLALESSPMPLLAVLGASCFLMAKIIPGSFRKTCEATQSARRTWFEK